MLIALGLLIASWLVFVGVINFDTKQTAIRLCGDNTLRDTTLFCPEDNREVYRAFDDQFNARPAHLFISDSAFREIFVPMGFSPGTMPASLAYESDCAYAAGVADAVGDRKWDIIVRCEDATYAAHNIVEGLRARIFITFSLWLISATLIVRYIMVTLYAYGYKRRKK